MDVLNPRIEARFRELPDDWAALRRVATKQASTGDSVDDDGAVRVGHRPWVAPKNFALLVCPPAPSSWYEIYEQLHAVVIPPSVRHILASANGIHALGLSLYGMPPSMVENPPRLDRSRLQCFDLATAIKDWSREFGAGSDLCHFGGRVARDKRFGYLVVLPADQCLLLLGQLKSFASGLSELRP